MLRKRVDAQNSKFNFKLPMRDVQSCAILPLIIPFYGYFGAPFLLQDLVVCDVFGVSVLAVVYSCSI